MADFVTLRRDVLGRFTAIVEALGGGQDLDEVLELIAKAVVDVIGFDAVAVNIRTHGGDLHVRTVVGPPELEELRGGTLSHDGWLDILDSGVAWGELRFLRTPELDDTVPHVDPWPERFAGAGSPDSGDDTEPWQPEFALLAPMWRSARDLLGVISVDLPRSGRTPDAEQRALLELFAGHAGAAVGRVHAFELANDRASLYRAAFAASPAPTAVLDEGLHLVDINDAFLEMADSFASELLGRKLFDVVTLDDADDVAAALAGLEADQGLVVGEECVLRHPRGHDWERWVDVAVRRVDAIASGARYVCLVTDRTTDRASMNEMRRRAEHDDLTGLKVRAVGLRELARRCGGATPPSGVGALLYCDLDNFKSINDTDGHSAGDRTLKGVASALSRQAGDDDVVCRWGGDEFGIVTTRDSVDDVVDLANRMVAGVRSMAGAADPADPVSRLGISVGIAAFQHPVNPHDVVLAADAALYRSKAHPTASVHLEML